MITCKVVPTQISPIDAVGKRVEKVEVVSVTETSITYFPNGEQSSGASSETSIRVHFTDDTYIKF